MVEVVCINDSSRPKEIPVSHWVKKDNTYHITKVTIHHNQNSIQGCLLYEIQLDFVEHFPYETFSLNRFGITEENLEKLIELIKNQDNSGDVKEYEKLVERELELV